MPIKKAAKKSMRKDKKRHLRNIAVKSELKTLERKLNSLVSNKKIAEAKKLLKVVFTKFDKAASNRIIHRNTASRKKSRLAKSVSKA